MWFNKGDPLSADTPLKPFWRTPTAFWTSTDAKDTKVLGYVYPETQDWKFENYTEYNRSVSKSVVRLYSGSTRDRLVGNENDIGEGEAASLQHVLVDNRYTDWEIKIQVPASSISGSFVMSFYLDSVVNGGVGGQREEGEVGAWILVMAAMDSDASEVETNGLDQVTKSTSTVSLTASLLDEVAAGRLASLEEEDVVPLLKERLSWRMRAVRFISSEFRSYFAFPPPVVLSASHFSCLCPFCSSSP